MEFSVRPCHVLYVFACKGRHACLFGVRTAPRCGPRPAVPSAWTTVSGRRIRAASTTASASRRLPAFGSARTVRPSYLGSTEIDENCSSRFWDRIGPEFVRTCRLKLDGFVVERWVLVSHLRFVLQLQGSNWKCVFLLEAARVVRTVVHVQSKPFL